MALVHQSSIGASVTFNGSALEGVFEIPDLIPAPETIEVTAIGDDTKQYIPGLKDPGNLEFSVWYDKTAYAAVKAAIKDNGEDDEIVITLKDTTTITVKGKATLGFSGFGAGDAVSYTISIAAKSVVIA